MDELATNDGFGTSLSLNSAGDRLAIGTPFDDGLANETTSAGAVYLFTFTDTAFSGGRLAAVVGKGYTGGRNVDVATLDGLDEFGFAVSLNAAGTRLAVGAPLDDGAGNTAFNAGAVYLFTFSDRSFSGGRLVAALGRDYIGDRDLDVAALEGGDLFGASVSLNGAGDRLAVGAPGDDGPGDPGYDSGAVYDTGAVHLFTFTNRSFAGARLAATVGRGFTGGGNVDLFSPEEGDRFGDAVSLNAAGTRLAIGAPHDDGPGNGTNSSGAVYLFTFTNRSFGGRAARRCSGQGLLGRAERGRHRAGGGRQVRPLAVAERCGHPPRGRRAGR